MGNKEITARLRIEAIIDEAQKELNTFGNSLKKTWQYGDPPKKLTKEIEALKVHLSSLQEISKKGVVNSSDLTRAQSDYKAFRKSIHDLTVEFKLFTPEQKKALLSTQEQENLKARTQAIDKYTQSLKRNEEVLKQRAPLEEKKQQLTSQGNQLQTLKKGYSERLNNLKQNGPAFDAKAKQFASNQADATRIQKLIEQAENRLQSGLAKGEKEDGAAITRIKNRLIELKKQLNDIDTETGKIEYTSSIASHEQAIKVLENSIISTNEAIDKNKESLHETEKELKALKTIDPSEEFNKLKETLKELGVEGIENAEDVDTLRKAVEKLEKGSLKRVDNELEKMGLSLKKMSNEADKAKEEIDEVTGQIKKQNEAIAKQEAFEQKIKQFLGFAGAAQLLRKALRDSMATIKELDATMTEMAVVTDLTVGDYWKQLPEYSKQASELGVSINSAYEAATLYYQQGLKGNEVTKISAQTLKMARIAGLSAADATDKMTAALRGFNMEINEESAQRVADVYSELAAITAANVNEISSAMSKTASIASSAGMEFETTAAFLAQIVETTRESAETAGTALKTVIARFQELKKDPLEIGEVDGEIVDANRIETALRTVGVALRDSSGQFRDLDEVFLELSSKWDSLDTNTQRYIATIAAGSRQQSRFIAMMSNYARTQELVAAANNSAGASQKQFEKTMESLQSKLEKLKNAWDEFSMGIVNSDLVKFGVDILTKFLEVINKATSAFNGLGGSITKIAGILIVFKMGQKIFEKLKAPLVQFFQEIIREARNTGKKAGEAAKEGLEQSGRNDDKTNKKSQRKMDVAKGAIESQILHDRKKQLKENNSALVEYGLMTGNPMVQGVIDQNQSEINNIDTQLQEKKQTNSPKFSNILSGVKTGLSESFQNSSFGKANVNRKEANLAQEEATKAYNEMNTISTDVETQSIAVQEEENKLKLLQEERKTLKSIATDTKKSDAERAAAGKKISKIDKEITEQQKKTKIEKDKLAKEQKRYSDAEEKFNNETEKYIDNQDKMWKNIGTGISNAGSKIAGVGVAVSMLGGLFEELGLEGLGKTFSTVGQYATVFGSALVALGPVVTFFGKTVSGVAKGLQAAGWSTMMSWIWVVAIVAAIALLIVAVVSIFKHINDNSPEKKLEKAQQNADAAAEAADRAKESFEGLVQALDELDKKYNALEDLTKGTDEWNKAVQDVNASVLDLINKYPELSGLVENEGGVLTIDVDSDEVQAVIGKYEKTAIAAKGAELGAKANLNRAQTEYKLDKMDDKIFDKFVTNRGEAFGTAIGNTLAAGAAGAAGGAAIGAAGGAIGGPLAAFTAMGGMIIGGIAGLTAGIATFQYTMDQVEKSNEQNRQNVKDLAQAYAKGETGETVEEIAAYIEKNGMAVGNAAKEMAESLLEESEAMLEFGNSLNAMDAQQKAYYQAMATNAQQLIDMGSYTEQQMDQMATVVDEDLMKNYEEDKRAELEKIKNADDSSSDEWENTKEDYAKQQYGANVRVDGNKIIDEKGETIREFSDDDAWIAEMAAADATLRAAEAMEQIPGIVNQNMKTIGKIMGDEASRILEKAMSGKDLTKAELDAYKESLGEATYTYIDEEGTTHSGVSADEAWNALNDESKQAWGSKEAYIKSLDKDYKNIGKMWNDLSDTQKKVVYGWDGTSEGLEQAMERFEATFTEVAEEQTQAFANAERAAKKLGLEGEMSSRLDSKAAQGWYQGLLNIAPGAEEGEMSSLNSALDTLLGSMDPDEVSAAMAQINAIDKTNIDAWSDLGNIFKEMNIEYNAEALAEFARQGIQASNAIKKIDFTNLHNQINETYKLLDKIKKGGRTYSEDDYKAIIASNKDLKENFLQIGDQFYYVGGTMKELEDAVRKNTTAILGDAEDQLRQKSGMANIVDANANKFGNVSGMDNEELKKYLIFMREEFWKSGFDLSTLGVEGLSMDTEFSVATGEQLKKWGTEVAALAGQKDTFATDYAEQLRQADIQVYAQENSAKYNAEMAAKEDYEYADEHQQALLLQAIQSGGVSNELIEQYQAAIASGNKKLIKEIGEKIAEAADTIVEGSEGRDAYLELIDRTTTALLNQRQKEIDALSEINESINEANTQMVEKVQQQIDAERQARENEQIEKELSELYSKLAYLQMDTSGTELNQLSLEDEIKEKEQEYQDNRLDQMITNLQESNSYAAKQREQQINLLQTQLDTANENGSLTREAVQTVNESLNQLKTGTTLDKTTMGALLFGTEGKNLSSVAAVDWKSSLQLLLTSALDYFNGGLSDDEQNYVTGVVDGENPSSSKKPKTTSQKKDVAVDNTKKLLQNPSATTTGLMGLQNNSDFLQYKEDYLAAGGTEENFNARVREAITGGHFPDNSGVTSWKKLNDNWYEAEIKINGFNAGKVGVPRGADQIAAYKASDDVAAEINAYSGYEGAAEGQKGYVAMYNNEPYVHDGHYWFRVVNGHSVDELNSGYEATKTAMKKYLWGIQYKTGGLADFTGPAWLDGTKSKPEIVLNQRDSANFIVLRDILSEILQGTSFVGKNSTGQTNTGDNHFEIEINVEKLENDYDVEQLANKIRSLIYEDATYRNVNAVNNIR